MDGILLVDKPRGWTSHDVVNFIRRRFGIVRAGHAGTLDPLATGLLVILIGKATKQSGRFIQHDKEYRASVALGASTDTGDSEGKIITEKEVAQLDRSAIESVFESFTGKHSQVPPMYSALKKAGKKLYEMARSGQSVERQPRNIEIKKIKINEIKMPNIEFEVLCSKGTYIRTLCEDIGKALGYPAHMSALVRLRCGEFLLEQAVSVEQLKNESRQQLKERLMSCGP